MWGYMGDYGHGWGMAFAMLLFWGVLIIVLMGLGKYIPWIGTGNGQVHEKSALDILKERYARGEIEREEFDQKKRDLKI